MKCSIKLYIKAKFEIKNDVSFILIIQMCFVFLSNVSIDNMREKQNLLSLDCYFRHYNLSCFFLSYTSAFEKLLHFMK